MTKKSLIILITIPMLILFAGCGVRKKNLLNKLSTGMTKESVKKSIGTPDLIQCPTTNTKGDSIDIWEYSLATVDEAIEQKRSSMQILGWWIFWPLLLFPQAWENPYTYETYLLKFVNNYLMQWGKEFEINTAKTIFPLKK